MRVAPEREGRTTVEPEREVPAPGRERAGALDQLGQSFKGAMAALRRVRGRETHRADGVSVAQYGLLFSLCDGAPRSARELAEAADLSPATVAEMLDGLVGAGLVARARSEHDKRVVLTSLTDRGCELVEAHRATWEERWRAALADFSEQQLLTASAVLDRIRQMFDDATAGTDGEV